MGTSVKGVSKILIPAGIFLLFASLLGACAYSSCFFDENSYVQYNYGRDGSIYKAVLSTACLSGIGCAVALTSIILMFFDCKSLITLIFYIITMVLFVGCLISESITLDYSKWSGYPVPGTYDYPDNSDFHDFLYASGHSLFRSTTFSKSEKEQTPEHSKSVKGVPYAGENDIGISPYTIQFTNPYYDPRLPEYTANGSLTLSTLSCYYQSDALRYSHCGYPGSDDLTEDCEITVANDQNSDCIGGWTLERYASYEQARRRAQYKAQSEIMEKLLNDGYEAATKSGTSKQARSADYLDVNVLYVITATFLGLQVSGFVLLLIGIIMNCADGGKGVVGA